METFLIAYLIVWLAVTAYVVRLGAEHRRLRQSLAALQEQLASQRPEQSATRAA